MEEDADESGTVETLSEGEMMVDAGPQEVQVIDDYSSKTDFWIIEESVPREISILGPEGVSSWTLDVALTLLENRKPDFDVENQDTFYRVVDIGRESVTLLDLSDYGGEGFRLEKVSEDELPEHVLSGMPGSYLDNLPFREVDHYRLRDGYLQEIDFNAAALDSEYIGEAQEVLGSFHRMLEEDRGEGIAWGRRSQWSL